jgi:hypothetical protein
MKKRNQVRRNGSPAAAAPQSKTHGADGATAQTPDLARAAVARHNTRPGRAGRGGLTFILQHPDGREWERVEFNPSVRRRIESVTKAAGIALPEFVREALRSYVDSVETEAA